MVQLCGCLGLESYSLVWGNYDEIAYYISLVLMVWFDEIKGINGGFVVRYLNG